MTRRSARTRTPRPWAARRKQVSFEPRHCGLWAHGCMRGASARRLACLGPIVGRFFDTPHPARQNTQRHGGPQRL